MLVCLSVSCHVEAYVFHIVFFRPWCSYIIEEGVCYLCLCEPSYPSGLAFEYLKAVYEEFSKQCGRRIYDAHRPYYFIEFGELSSQLKLRGDLHDCIVASSCLLHTCTHARLTLIAAYPWNELPLPSPPSPPSPLPLHSLSPGAGTEIEQIKKGYSENRPRSQLSHVASELQGVQRIMFDNIGAVLKRGEMIESESCIACGSLTRQTFQFVRGKLRGAIISSRRMGAARKAMSVGRVCTCAGNYDVMWCAHVCVSALLGAASQSGTLPLPLVAHLVGVCSRSPPVMVPCQWCTSSLVNQTLPICRPFICDMTHGRTRMWRHS